MNALEKIVYDIVKRNPNLKAGIVRTYQALFAVVPFARLQSIAPVNVRDGYFFGFHDKCPWSDGNKHLLAHRVLTGNRIVRQGDEIEVGYFSGSEWQEFNAVAKTQAWDWQLGSMLQWLNKQQLLFNDFNEGRYCSKIHDIDDSKTRTLERPIVAASPDATTGVSYDFDRVHVAMPGYGYACRSAVPAWKDADYPDQGKLYVVNLLNGNSEVLFTLDDILQIDHEPSMDGAFHFFHHVLFSPNSQRFVFFHRWVCNGNQRFTRMFSCAIDGSDLHRFPTDGMVSHIGWRDSSHIFAYARVAGEDGYYLFEDQSDRYERIGEESFNSDGHPQYSRQGLVLTDTYPDRFRLQYLAVYDPARKSRTDIARTRLPWRLHEELRVDLHPRWDRDGSIVCFDSGHTGTRSLCTMRLPEEFKSCKLQ